MVDHSKRSPPQKSWRPLKKIDTSKQLSTSPKNRHFKKVAGLSVTVDTAKKMSTSQKRQLKQVVDLSKKSTLRTNVDPSKKSTMQKRWRHLKKIDPQSSCLHIKKVSTLQKSCRPLKKSRTLKTVVDSLNQVSTPSKKSIPPPKKKDS